MPTTIRYADILNYLTAIANKANNPIGDAPHGAWWSGLSYNDFLTGQVTNLGVNIMDSSTPLQSAFYVILTNPSGYQGFNQMPGGDHTACGAVHHRRGLHRDPTRRDDDLRGADPGEHRVVALERLPRE